MTEVNKARLNFLLDTANEVICDTAKHLGCEPDNEEILSAIDRLKGDVSSAGAMLQSALTAIKSNDRDLILKAADGIRSTLAALSSDGFNEPYPHEPEYPFPMRKFSIGDRVRIRIGGEQGRIVGVYTSSRGEHGYCIESAHWTRKGMVQLACEAALEYVSEDTTNA